MAVQSLMNQSGEGDVCTTTTNLDWALRALHVVKAIPWIFGFCSPSVSNDWQDPDTVTHHVKVDLSMPHNQPSRKLQLMSKLTACQQGPYLVFFFIQQAIVACMSLFLSLPFLSFIFFLFFSNLRFFLATTNKSSSNRACPGSPPLPPTSC